MSDFNIGYHTSYNFQTRQPWILDRIQQEWGASLEYMTYEQKIVMRAALADYVANKPVHQSGMNIEISLIDCCIESAGVDWDIWNKDSMLVEVIQKCSELSEDDIEELTIALSLQIKHQVYASRLKAA